MGVWLGTGVVGACEGTKVGCRVGVGVGILHLSESHAGALTKSCTKHTVWGQVSGPPSELVSGKAWGYEWGVETVHTTDKHLAGRSEPDQKTK